jgi:hypothetical protein
MMEIDTQAEALGVRRALWAVYLYPSGTAMLVALGAVGDVVLIEEIDEVHVFRSM